MDIGFCKKIPLIERKRLQTVCLLYQIFVEILIHNPSIQNMPRRRRSRTHNYNDQTIVSMK